MNTSIVAAVTISASQENAFRIFTSQLPYWWPKAYTWSQDKLVQMVIEPHIDGKCYETGPHHFRCDWGRVLAINEPEMLSFSWQIAASRAPEPDPDKAGIVTVTFMPAGDHLTEVKLEHSEFDKYGEGWEQYAAAMGSEQGWPYILQALKKAVEEQG
jgi:uncharacterized protein YndB with AHSA1/START domain